jgi:LDH2 family malate/lactate/ureidoglycolate dehydrogenase
VSQTAGPTVALAADEARRWTTDALVSAGASAANARTVAHYLVLADLRGVETHGLVRMPLYVARMQRGDLDGTADPEVLTDRGVTALVDGCHGFGQVVADRAMRLAMERAGSSGVAVVVARRSSHFGAAAGYTQLAAEHGLIGIATTNTAPVMPPTGGRERRLGNNPISIAVPRASGGPIVLDMAMSVVAAWRIRLAADRGEPIPDTWALDAEGRPTTDPYEAFQGGGLLQPIGAHKGYGLAFMVDVLTAVLAGGAFGADVKLLHDEGRLNTSHFFLALDPGAFGPTEEFDERLTERASQIRNTQTSPDTDRVLLPGEREASLKVEREQTGIPYRRDIFDGLVELSTQLSVDPPAVSAAEPSGG